MKIGYGIHDYKTIKSEDYLFIDKTKYIEVIEKIGRYIVYLRPRRFGKSLFTSMLYYYYDVNNESTFDNLFSDTYIGESKTKEANSYFILKFDFSGISTERDEIEKDFYNGVCIYLKRFIDYYGFEININENMEKSHTVLKQFLSQFEAKVKRQIYLIIDEYDHFANNVLTSDIKLFNEITGKDGFLRSFYEVFKTYAGTVIGRMFITGVTPITLDSLTSGFNMAKNFAKHEVLNEMMGFTEEEVSNVLKKLNIDPKYLSVLKDNYNGYLFSEDADSKVYNSNMVMYYLDSMLLFSKPPKNLADPNVVSDYTKVTRMFDLYNNIDDKKQIIHTILNNESLTATIVDKFNLNLGFDRDDFLSILYYLGLITVDGGYGTETNLKTPNYIIKNIYFEYYYYYLSKELNINIDVSHIRSAVRELSMNKNTKPFISLIEKFLKEIDNRDFIKFDEKYIKLLMMTYVSLSGLYMIKSEYPIDKYYIDLAFFPNRIFELENYYVIELKYISKGSYSDKLLTQKKTEAIGQIDNYSESKELKSIHKLRKYICIFVHDKCRVMEEIY